METAKQINSFINFWKIPTDLVSINGEGTETSSKQGIIAMPSEGFMTRASLYRWENARLYTPISGCNSVTGDISSAIRVDTISHTVSLPFNFNQAVQNLLTEQYIQRESGQFIVRLIRQFYYKLKPLLPRYIQVQIRQKAVARMGQRKFPTWELDTSVDFLYRNLLMKLLEANPGSSLPIISFWPRGADMCLLLSHDVETIAGIENIEKIVNIEQKLGFRSVWNFVPERYPIDLRILRELQASGFEVGVHGLCHDGRLFELYNLFTQGAGIINEYIKLWGSVGFRSPSNLRNLDWISEHIEVDYDTSSVSTEWYGAQPGGRCTVFPFIFQDIVELPITLQQDFTLLDILKLTENQTLTHWMSTVNSIKKMGGMVLINVHPDYMNSPERLKLYENFLNAIKIEDRYWHTLPKEATRWWIDRNSSELTSSGADWHIVGPASDRGMVMKASICEGKLCIQPN